MIDRGGGEPRRGQLRSKRHLGHALHLAHHLPLHTHNDMTQPRLRTRPLGTT